MRGCIPKLFLERAITKMGRNTAGGAKFVSTTMACFVHGRDGGVHPLLEERKTKAASAKA